MTGSAGAQQPCVYPKEVDGFMLAQIFKFKQNPCSIQKKIVVIINDKTFTLGDPSWPSQGTYIVNQGGGSTDIREDETAERCPNNTPKQNVVQDIQNKKWAGFQLGDLLKRDFDQHKNEFKEFECPATMKSIQSPDDLCVTGFDKGLYKNVNLSEIAGNAKDKSFPLKCKYTGDKDNWLIWSTFYNKKNGSFYSQQHSITYSNGTRSSYSTRNATGDKPDCMEFVPDKGQDNNPNGIYYLSNGTCNEARAGAEAGAGAGAYSKRYGGDMADAFFIRLAAGVFLECYADAIHHAKPSYAGIIFAR